MLNYGRFQLQYAGIGYIKTCTYQLVEGKWQITGEEDIPPEAFKKQMKALKWIGVLRKSNII